MRCSFDCGHDGPVRGLLIGLALAACGPTRAQVVLPEPPVDASASSLVLVFEGDTTFLYAIDLTDSAGPLLDLVTPGWTRPQFTAVAFAFDRPLADYDLEPGFLDVVAGPRSCGLERPSAVATYDSSKGTWQALDPPTHGALGRLIDEAHYGCTKRDLCRTFTAQTVTLEHPDNVSILLPLDDTKVLIGVTYAHFYEVSPTEAVERTDLAGLPSSSGSISETGEIWLGGHGVIARGTLLGGFEETTVGEYDDEVGAIAVRGRAAAEEGLAIAVTDIPDSDTATITVYRLRGGVWTPIERHLEPSGDASQCAIRWLGDQALLVFSGIHGLAYDGAGLTSFALDSPIPLFEPRLNAIAGRDDFGVVIGTNDGYLYHLAGGLTDFVAIPTALLGNGIDAVAPAYEGFLFGGPDGTVNQFYPDTMGCSAERLATSDAERILQVGERIVITGGNPDYSRPNTVTWLSE